MSDIEERTCANPECNKPLIRQPSEILRNWRKRKCCSLEHAKMIAARAKRTAKKAPK